MSSAAIGAYKKLISTSTQLYFQLSDCRTSNSTIVTFMEKLNLSADELLSTTRSVRKRLDFDRPVDEKLITECLELAVQAPTGSNSQNWHFLVITDPKKRSALADIYRKGFKVYANMVGSAGQLAETAENEERAAQQMRVTESATYLAENMHRVPVMMIPCLPGRVDQMPGLAGASLYGSIIPSAWSFMLAARERDLGTCWTTIHLIFEQEASEVLGIPFEEVTQVALITAAHTLGSDFKPAKRIPMDEVVSWNDWKF